MTEVDRLAAPPPALGTAGVIFPVSGRAGYLALRRLIELGLALALALLAALLGLLLLALNPWLNPGPLIFAQRRMGRHCRAFTVYKFRSMRPAGRARGPLEPLERGRIPPLGRLLRRARLDELPQALNVLRGEMSLIGPRPDCLEHARTFLASVPGYRERHRIRPGISGLAQIEIGYAEGHAGACLKTRADLYYIRNRGPRLDGWILLRTIGTVLTGKGA